MNDDPIAIIGFSLRFPQDADSAEAFWEMLYNGQCAMTEVPADRFTIDSFYAQKGEAGAANGTVRPQLLKVPKGKNASNNLYTCALDLPPGRTFPQTRPGRIRRSVLQHHAGRGRGHGPPTPFDAGDVISCFGKWCVSTTLC
jgi:hypothetical protein